jgi:hypothetical protein
MVVNSGNSIFVIFAENRRFTYAGDWWLSLRWIAKLVSGLLVTASFVGSNPDIPKKPQHGRHKQRSGQHTVARQKIRKT